MFCALVVSQYRLDWGSPPPPPRWVSMGLPWYAGGYWRLQLCAQVVYAQQRYTAVQEALERGQFKINSGGINLMLALLVFVSLACLVVVIVWR